MATSKKQMMEGRQVTLNTGNEVITGELISNEEHQEKENKPPEINIGADIEVFGFQLKALLEKKEKSLKVMVIPGMEVGQKVELSQLASKLGCNDLKDRITELCNNIGEFIGLDINNVTLQQIFFYADTETNTVEYAIAIKIGKKNDGTEQRMFAIHEITIAVWNTELEGIKKEMNLIHIDEYLKEMQKK
ncbi:hypothetical protein [Klebsiella quasivariicola]|uniref:hypothetical protein n=1 Tax=Klebsiella quasivariicola TaxID=2026240 RepID=UPI002478E39F|nr:hypothetical protein [Klebsiella quasivariicola]